MPKVGQPISNTTPLVPFWQTTDHETVRLYHGNVTDVLQRMTPNSVHTVITSPPYWSLRSYLDKNDPNKVYEIGSEPSPDCGTHGKAQCGKCFTCSMVKVFRAVKRVLRYDGTLWLNLGDSYGEGGQLQGVPWRVALALQADGWVLRSDIVWVKRGTMPESASNRPCKSMEYVFMFSKQIPYFFDMEAIKPGATPAERVVTGKAGSAGQAAGMGRKPSGNGVPGSVMRTGDTRNFRQTDLWFQSVNDPWGFVGVCDTDELVGLDVTSQGYEGAHYACFPPKLITPMIKAATSEKGCCAKCGCPWKRVVEKKLINDRGSSIKASRGKGVDESMSWDQEVCGHNETKTLGWEPNCTCNGRIIRKVVKVQRPVSLEGTVEEVNDRDRSMSRNRNGKSGSLDGKERKMVEVEEERWVYEPRIPLDEHEITPAVVLDPFIGSGTTCAVSIDLGRYSVGIDLNEKYLTNNAVVRVKGTLMSRSAMAHLAGVKRVNVLDKRKGVADA